MKHEPRRGDFWQDMRDKGRVFNYEWRVKNNKWLGGGKLALSFTLALLWYYFDTTLVRLCW